jgi:hypothetical protein
MSKKRFTVGQQVVRVRRGGYSRATVPRSRIGTVCKVGTKYVEIYRSTRATRSVQRKNGQGAPPFATKEINEIVESREAWEQRQRERAERKSFRQQASAYSFEDELEFIPIEDIRTAAKLLGIKLEKGQ